jgi:hypothetical protein
LVEAVGRVKKKKKKKKRRRRKKNRRLGRVAWLVEAVGWGKINQAVGLWACGACGCQAPFPTDILPCRQRMKKVCGVCVCVCVRRRKKNPERDRGGKGLCAYVSYRPKEIVAHKCRMMVFLRIIRIRIKSLVAGEASSDFLLDIFFGNKKEEMKASPYVNGF